MTKDRLFVWRLMHLFDWPDNIQFDDSAEDINQARRAWLSAHNYAGQGGRISDFLEFMQAYGAEMESRRKTCTRESRQPGNSD